MKLASIELRNKNYEQAVNYLDEAQKYSYRVNCGNAFISDLFDTVNMYSECYINLKNDEKLYDVLIPVLNLLRENSAGLSRLHKTLLKKYKKVELKKLFEESFKAVYTKETVISNTNITVNYIKFLNRDIIYMILILKNYLKLR